MRPYMTLLGTLLSLGSIAQKSDDGPYVFYKHGTVIQERVQHGQFYRDTLQVKEKIVISVEFSTNAAWNFTVKLKDTLENEPTVFEQPSSIFVLSDTEGEFEGLRNLLLANKIIDQKYNWTFGKGHLVLCGDLFDRGENVTESLWLLYKLEQGAMAAGGYVHIILGNHDIMNLSGDLRYLQPKYPEAARQMGRNYMELYSVDTELGRWLRTKNTVEKIGENLCLHAGVAPSINKLQMPLHTINAQCRPWYDKARTMKGVPDSAVTKFFEGNTSLFWYRGYFMEPKATEEEVNETLRLYGCTRIVVGHTIVPGNIGFYYSVKVLGLDVDHHKGDHQAALYLKGNWYSVNDKGEKKQLRIH